VCIVSRTFRQGCGVEVRSAAGSSDGGAILLKAAERRYGLIEGFAGCLEDKRQAGKVDHSLKQLLAQRVFYFAFCARSEFVAMR
jgi:ethanolamine utilization microcompartment shell protein EutS